MLEIFENRENLINKYHADIVYVCEHNGDVDTHVAYEMIVANAFRGGSYDLPEGFDLEAFKTDYLAFFGD